MDTQAAPSKTQPILLPLINRLQKFRGFLAHTDGVLLEHHNDQRKFAEENEHLEVDGDRVVLDSGFLPWILETQRILLNSLEQIVLERFPVEA